MVASAGLVVGCAQTPLMPAAIEGPYALFLNMQGIKCCDGALRVAVYNSESLWLHKSGMVQGQIRKVLGGAQRFEIYGLPAGEYALAVHQDLNLDGKLNKFLGLLPREPYGFSNNAGKRGLVSFSEAKVLVHGDAEITIQLHPPVF